MSTEDVEYGIAPLMQGHITSMDLIDSIASVTFLLRREDLSIKDGKLFFIKFPTYQLEAGISKKGLFLIRNGMSVLKNFEYLSGVSNMVFCVIQWNFTRLQIILLDDSYEDALKSGGDLNIEYDKRSSTIETPPTLPPNSLLEWARKQAIIPKHNYESVHEFYEVITSSFQAIASLTDALGSTNQFWDRIDSETKTPKRETEIHNIVHSLLYHIAIAKNFDVHRESFVAGGNIEFILSGTLTSNIRINVCVEFKHAHSNRLEHGLLYQLPKYMEQKGCDYGLYVVLYFKGEDFDRPDESLNNLEQRLHELAIANGHTNIRILIWDLSKRIPPSKIKISRM